MKFYYMPPEVGLAILIYYPYSYVYVADSIENWESIIQKTVRSSEGNLIGNVDAVDESSILVSTEGGRTRYRIPKHIVQGFDGHQVSLNLQKIELERFKGGEAEGFREVK